MQWLALAGVFSLVAGLHARMAAQACSVFASHQGGGSGGARGLGSVPNSIRVGLLLAGCFWLGAQNSGDVARQDPAGLPEREVTVESLEVVNGKGEVVFLVDGNRKVLDYYASLGAGGETALWLALRVCSDPQGRPRVEMYSRRDAGPAFSLGFSDDGKTLQGSAHGDDSVRLWSIAANMEDGGWVEFLGPDSSGDLVTTRFPARDK